jgi:hypothetical protein
MNRDNVRPPARSVANLEFHHSTDQVNHVARKVVSELERKQIRAVNGGAAGFPMECPLPGCSRPTARVPVTDLDTLVTDMRSALSRFVLCRAIGIPVLLLTSAVNVCAVHPVAQLNESSESAKHALDRATGKALQGDVTSAVKILLDVPASEYSSEDMEWRSCMIDRLAHETQHFADKYNFGKLEPWEMEYRAKLTELTLAVSTQDSTLQRICENRSQVKDSAHAYANFQVVRGLEQLLGPTRPNICGPSGSKGQALRDAAKARLFADSEERKRSKPR